MRNNESTNELRPAEFFAFDVSKLKPGDILPSTVPNNPKSIAILNPEVTEKPGRWADIAAPVEELDATGHRSRHRAAHSPL